MMYSPEERATLAKINQASEEINLYRSFCADETARHDWVDYDRGVRGGDTETMVLVAKNEHCPASILERIYERTCDRHVLAELGSNANTPAGILAELAVHEDEWVAYRAKRNRNLPENIRAMLCLAE